MESVQRVSTEHNRRISQAFSDVGRQLMRFIRARVPTDEDAEDISQDVWQQLATTLSSGPVEQLGAWLYTVARNRIIDRYRKPRMASLDALTEDPDDEPGLDFASFLLREEKTPRSEHQHHLFWETLYSALAELPEQQRQVFVWHELEALSFQDIAALTGENVNTLLSRKRYAVLHLRKRLGSLRDDFISAR